MNVRITLTTYASNPLNEAQLRYLQHALDSAMTNLPYSDFNNFTDLPEYTSECRNVKQDEMSDEE